MVINTVEHLLLKSARLALGFKLVDDLVLYPRDVQAQLAGVLALLGVAGLALQLLGAAQLLYLGDEGQLQRLLPQGFQGDHRIDLLYARLPQQLLLLLHLSLPLSLLLLLFLYALGVLDRLHLGVAGAGELGGRFDFLLMLALVVPGLDEVPLAVGLGPDIRLRLVAVLFLELFGRDALVEVGVIEVNLRLVLHVELGDEFVLGWMAALVVGDAFVFVHYLLVGLLLQHCLQ